MMSSLPMTVQQLNCWVPNCPVSGGYNFFYGLPHDVVYRETWLALAGKPACNTDMIYFCENHFRSEDVAVMGGKKFLNTTSLPSRKMPQKFCRTCLVVMPANCPFHVLSAKYPSKIPSNMRLNLWLSTSILTSPETLLYILKFSIPELKVSTNPPSVVCSKCFYYIWKLYEFKLSCFAAEQRLWLNLPTPTKDSFLCRACPTGIDGKFVYLTKESDLEALLQNMFLKKYPQKTELPLRLCVNCFYNLQNVQVFYQKCLSVEVKLRQYECSPAPAQRPAEPPKGNKAYGVTRLPLQAHNVDKRKKLIGLLYRYGLIPGQACSDNKCDEILSKVSSEMHMNGFSCNVKEIKDLLSVRKRVIIPVHSKDSASCINKIGSDKYGCNKSKTSLSETVSCTSDAIHKYTSSTSAIKKNQKYKMTENKQHDGELHTIRKSAVENTSLLCNNGASSSIHTRREQHSIWTQQQKLEFIRAVRTEYEWSLKNEKSSNKVFWSPIVRRVADKGFYGCTYQKLYAVWCAMKVSATVHEKNGLDLLDEEMWSLLQLSTTRKQVPENHKQSSDTAEAGSDFTDMPVLEKIQPVLDPNNNGSTTNSYKVLISSEEANLNDTGIIQHNNCSVADTTTIKTTNTDIPQLTKINSEKRKCGTRTVWDKQNTLEFIKEMRKEYEQLLKNNKTECVRPWSMIIRKLVKKGFKNISDCGKLYAKWSSLKSSITIHGKCKFDVVSKEIWNLLCLHNETIKSFHNRKRRPKTNTEREDSSRNSVTPPSSSACGEQVGSLDTSVERNEKNTTSTIIKDVMKDQQKDVNCVESDRSSLKHVNQDSLVDETRISKATKRKRRTERDTLRKKLKRGERLKLLERMEQEFNLLMKEDKSKSKQLWLTVLKRVAQKGFKGCSARVLYRTWQNMYQHAILHEDSDEMSMSDLRVLNFLKVVKQKDIKIYQYLKQFGARGASYAERSSKFSIKNGYTRHNSLTLKQRLDLISVMYDFEEEALGKELPDFWPKVYKQFLEKGHKCGVKVLRTHWYKMLQSARKARAGNNKSTVCDNLIISMMKKVERSTNKENDHSNKATPFITEVIDITGDDDGYDIILNHNHISWSELLKMGVIKEDTVNYETGVKISGDNRDEFKIDKGESGREIQIEILDSDEE